MQLYGTQYFYILKLESDLQNKNTVFNLKWPQAQTQANAVVNDETASYYFYGGILKDSGGTFFTAIVDVRFNGEVQQIFTIRKSSSTQQFSIKSLDYLRDTSAGTRCLVACAEDGQNILFMKLNVNSARTQVSQGSSTYLVSQNNNQLRLGEADFSAFQYRQKDISYYSSSLNNQFFSGWMDLSQVLYVGTISTFTSETPTTTSFTQKVGWLMNFNPSESEITITNSLSSPSSMASESLTFSTLLTSTFVSTSEATGFATKTSTSSITYIVSQIFTTSLKTIITPSIGNKVYIIGSSAMTITIPAYTLQQICSDLIFKYTSDISTVSGFVTFDTNTRVYTVSTSTQAYNGEYTIKMLGRINHEQSAEVSFQLTLIGACSYVSITSTSQTDITYTDIGTYTFELKGTNSQGLQSATQQFTIKIQDACQNDAITPSAILSSYDYLIESGIAQSIFTLSWTHSLSYCGSLAYQVVNQADSSTADSIFYISSNQFYVSTSNSAKINNYNLRIIGGTAYKTINQDFAIVVKSECPSVVITPETIADKAYTLGSDSQSFSFSDWSLSIPACGPITYSLLIDDSVKPSWL
ncbi:UNKNOWN [Stylonychia lemnae]|uniref:Uncharacterized protein n=1 Tax=Stylonychia lemnae TaxID=5949 RepID=A0A078A7M7_STYLE|nr:UNKNOWN [Stylonychia lemnae]|eukprot:CDW78244.1 UNKNOWN [Stylonychia lemnae]